jgi:hypothetical protein
MKPAPHKLTPIQRIIGWRMTEGRLVSGDEIYGAVWGNDCNGGPMDLQRTIGVHMVGLRAWCGERNIRIHNRKCIGWIVDDADGLRAALASELEETE